MKYISAVLLQLSCILLCFSPAQAEWYFGGQAGISLPNALSDIEETGVPPGIRPRKTGDLDLLNTPLFGAKVGYFFDDLPWLGIEGDFSYSTPHIKQQNVTYDPFQLLLPPQTVLTPGAHLRLISGTINALLRYPGKRFQPYLGGGVGIAQAKLKDLHQPVFLIDLSRGTTTPIGFNKLESSDIGIQFNVIAGIRTFLTKKVAIFTEYRYSRSSFDFEDRVNLRADYSAHNLVIGASFHLQ